MQFRILGSFEVVGDDGTIPLPEGRARSLLAILVLHAGQVVSTDQLIDLLWGASPPATSLTKLYGLISTLRKKLEPGGETDASLIRRRPPGYVLAIDPGQVDAARFRRLVETAAELPAVEKAKGLREALGLWRGPALADFTYEPFAQAEISSLDETRLSAVESRIAAELELGRHTELIPELERLTAEHPFREGLRAQTMLAHYRSGNQQKALSVYRDAYDTLTEELGIEPGPKLQDLEEAILRHDPSLHAMSSQAGDREETVDGPWPSESRKLVTVTYVDMRMPAGSASDPEAHRTLTRRAHETITLIIRGHGGTSQGSIGGVNVSVFGIPTAHEDDSQRAVRAATEIKDALRKFAREDGEGPEARIGINTGEVIVGDTGLTGSVLPEDTVRVTARLQQSAEAGEILLGDRTRQIVSQTVTVEPIQRHIADDAGNRLPAWRLVSADPSLPRYGPATDTPLVGRAQELGRLRDALRQTGHTGASRRLTVVGNAGIGKSRLALEFAESAVGQARVLTGHCPPYGDGITFWPLREIVELAAGGTRPETIGCLLRSVHDADSIAIHVAGAIGATESPLQPDVLFPSVRVFFETLARDRPLVLVIEDVHWAQPRFVELIDYLTEFVDGPVMLLCLARPEIDEQYPGFANNQDNSETLGLGPLETADVEELVEFNLTQHGASYERVLEVIDVAEGNPLFIQQLLAALREGDELTIPPSIHGLLLARLDRLGPAERDVIRAASVWGRRFEVTNVTDLLPPQAGGYSVPVHLESLERKMLIARVDHDHGFAFGHALIQLAAYQTITKDNRALLHERVADLLETSEAEVGAEEELIGYHLERAHGYRAELGIDDEHSRQLAERASGHLFRAGLSAFARFDAVGAQNLLERAEVLVPVDHPDRWSLRRHLVETYQVMGQHDQAEVALSGLIGEVASGDDPVLEHFLRLEQVWTRIAIGPDPMTLAEIEKVTDRARQVFEKAEDQTGLAQVARVMVHVYLRRGQMAEMEAAAQNGMYHAGRSDSAREHLGAQWMMTIALEEGPRSAEECIELCQEVADWFHIANPGVVSSLAYFRAMTGDFDRARQLAAEARRILKEVVSARRPLGGVLRRIVDVELLAGDFEMAEERLRDALAVNEDMGEHEMIAQITATLANVLHRKGEMDEAERFAVMSQDHAPAESVPAQTMWRCARARVMSSRGQSEKAEELVRDAEQLAPTDMLTLKAHVHLTLGEVLLHTGRQAEGERAIRDAIDLFDRKGNVAASEQARDLPALANR